MHCNQHIQVPSKMAEVDKIILSLIENDVPEGRKALRDGHENLAKVATYCQQKYSEANNRYKGAPDKAQVREDTREILNETKQFATQSLASVAYQINSLAVNMLNLLDQQYAQLQSMESKINYISQTVNIHKEKVARREIGVLATSKNTARTHKIIAPSKQEKPERYARKQIDYSILDDIGHGVKLTQSDVQQRRSVKKKPPSPAPGAPSGSLRNKPGSRMGISTGIKPPPPPVPPPMAPSIPADFDTTYETVKSTQPPAVAAPPPPVVNPSKVVVQPPVAPPPAPPMPSGSHSPPPPPFPTSTDLPPPASHVGETYEAVDDILNPPPPPPPTEDFYSSPSSLPMPLPPEDMYNSPQAVLSPIMPPPPPMLDVSVPDEYLEKVISLYEYNAMRDDELTFGENTVIYVVKKNDDGWYEGVIEGSGHSGLFPGNYVQPL